MDADSIIQRTSAAQTLADLPGLLKELELADPRILFRTLFPIASSAQDGGETPVAFSAYALHGLNPPCDLTVELAIEAIVNNRWDISIEEIPWYLVNQFGRDCVVSAAKAAIDAHSSEEARSRIRTIVYWAGLTPDGW